MSGPWDRKPETAEALARDLIGAIGRERAILHMATRLLRVRNWQEARQGWRLLAAVIAA